MTLKFNDPGHFDNETKRIAIPLIEFYDKFDPDTTCYLYNANAEELGLDPWRLVDSIDKHTNGIGFDIWADGAFMIPVSLDEKDTLKRVVYVSMKNIPAGYAIPEAAKPSIDAGTKKYGETKLARAKHTAFIQCLDAEYASSLLDEEFNIDKFLKQVKDSYLEYRNM